MKKNLAATALSVFFSCVMITPISSAETAEELYQKGVLYHEQWNDKALDYMEKSAQLGHTKAMCEWAEWQRPSIFMMSEESIKYYEKAKDAGDLCGYDGLMTSNDVDEEIRGKTPSKLTNEFISLAEKKAASGDSQAMISLAYFYNTDTSKGMGYLKKAAELGNADAMRSISTEISSGGDGWYIIPGSRKRAAREWMGKSAEAGNPLAMLDLADMYYAEDRNKSIMWFNKAVDKGFSRALNFMAVSYSGCYEEPAYKFNVDLRRSYFYAFAIKQSFGDGGIDRMAVDALLPKLEKKMTPAEIKEAKQDALEWLKTHQVRDYTVEFGMYL